MKINTVFRTGRIYKTATLCLTTALFACGGSSDDTVIETVNASFAEDSEYQQSFGFSDTPLVISNASNGNLSVSDSNVSYLPNQDFNGTDNAVIEAGNTRYEFSFTVTPVNDLPVLTESQILVTAGDQITGQLAANDVDGDTVTFSVAAAPENGTLTISDTGAFSYTPAQFELPVDNFTVQLDDGTETTTAQVELRPSYATNEDKRAYYYRSSQSHLKQAVNVLSNVDDDIATEDAYVALAIGYANAGLESQLQGVLENNLTTQQAAANAQRRLANFSVQQGNLEKARDYFINALQTYAQFIADNGINNISNNDASFIQGLANDARVLQDETLSNLIQQQLDLYLQELGGIDREYATPFGRFVTAYRFEVRDLLSQYLVDRTDDNFARALTAIEQFTAIARETGYQEVRRGENQGQRYYRLAPLYNAEAVGYFYDLGAFEQARDQLAYAFAYYGDVSYDENRAREALPHSDITRTEYTFPLIDVAYYFALLYPEQDTGIISALVDPSDIFADDVDNALADASAINIVLSGGDIATAVQEVETLYQGDLRDVVERLTSRGINSTPYFGETLLNNGLTEQAVTAYDRAFEILETDAYLQDNTRTTTYATGSRGCLKFVDFYLRVGLNDKATDAAATCEQIQQQYFSEENTDQRDVAEAYIDVIDAYTLTDNKTKTEETAVELRAYLDGVYSRSDVFERKAQVTAILMFNTSQNAAITSLQELVTELGSNSFDTFEQEVETYIEVLAAAVNFEFEDNSLLDRPATAISLRSQFNTDTYTDALSQFSSLTTELSDALQSATESLAVSELSGLYEEVIEVMAAARQYDAIRTLITTLGFTGEEAIIANATLANALALQDDFPSTDVASVDTDGDGLANFYAPTVSENEIAASGVEADQDSDNDGIADEEDLNPLGSNGS